MKVDELSTKSAELIVNVVEFRWKVEELGEKTSERRAGYIDWRSLNGKRTSKSGIAV